MYSKPQYISDIKLPVVNLILFKTYVKKSAIYLYIYVHSRGLLLKRVRVCLYTSASSFMLFN